MYKIFIKNHPKRGKKKALKNHQAPHHNSNVTKGEKKINKQVCEPRPIVNNKSPPLCPHPRKCIILSPLSFNVGWLQRRKKNRQNQEGEREQKKKN